MTRKSIFLCVAVVLLAGSFPDFGEAAQANKEVLGIAVAAEIGSLDPSLYAAGTDLIVVENWGEFLLHLEPSGKITPGLVASWKLSPDGKKMECTLRKGVKFHSGDSLTTKDVAFSLERGREKNNSVRSSYRSVERLEIIDDYRFIFHFKEPDVVFIPRRCANLAIVSKSYYDRVGEETFVKQPSGTGPYKVVNYRHGEYVDLERFEGYWGKKPPIKKARIYFIEEDTTRLAKLKAGEVDFIESVPYTEVKALEKDPNFKVVRLETNQPTMSICLGSQNQKMPWYDKRVRLAMASAVDYKSIIHNLLNDIPVHLATLAPHELGYDPEVKPYAYDLGNAKKLLAEAGYPTGFDMKMSFATGGHSSMSREVAEALASYLMAVGIRTQLIGEDQVAMLAGRKKALDPNGEYSAFYVGNLAGGADPTQSLETFFTKGGSRPIYSNPEIEKIVAEAKSTVNDAKRAVLIKKAVKILHDEVAMIPIFTTVSLFAMNKNIVFNPTKMINFDYVYVKDMAFK